MRIALAVVICVLASIVANPQIANAADRDRLQGRGTTIDYILRANVQSGPLGENPRGTFEVDFPDTSQIADRKVDVSCLLVVGNLAMAGGLDRTGTETFVFVHDNGETGDVTEFATAFNNAPAPDQARCAAMFASFESIPGGSLVVKGDFVVDDATGV